jgi:hypothetical protein
LGIALHHYHDVQRTLPSGWVADGDFDGPPGWAWGAMTLPFMEQNNLHDLIDFKDHIDEAVNAVARTRHLPFFICPSDRSSQKIFTLTADHDDVDDHDHGALPMEMARANYVGVFGPHEIEDHPSHGDGIFFHNSSVRLSSVLDGLSNTLMVGERSSKLADSTWVGVVHGAEEAMARVVGSADHPPNDPAAHFEDFSSDHPTGAQFLLGDASVHLLESNIDAVVYHQLATRAHGEPVTLPAR